MVGWQARERQQLLARHLSLFRLSSRVAPDLDALLRPALQDEMALMQVLACPHLALGIDALVFPRAPPASCWRGGPSAPCLSGR